MEWVLGLLIVLGLCVAVYWLGFRHGELMSKMTIDMQATRIEILEREIRILKLTTKVKEIKEK